MGKKPSLNGTGKRWFYADVSGKIYISLKKMANLSVVEDFPTIKISKVRLGTILSASKVLNY